MIYIQSVPGKFLRALLLELLLPRWCCGCGRIGSYLCPACYERIHFFSQPIPLTLQPLYLDELIAAAHYRAPLSSLIREMKYSHVKDLAPLAAEIIHFAVSLPPIDLITAVPLHPHRQRERGFNQAEEIARRLAELMRLPYQPLLLRSVDTPFQAKILDRQIRLQQLQACFAINPHLKKNLFQGKIVLLVDDVTTTGTTLNQCAKVLRASGSEKIIGLTLAHGS